MHYPLRNTFDRVRNLFVERWLVTSLSDDGRWLRYCLDATNHVATSRHVWHVDQLRAFRS